MALETSPPVKSAGWRRQAVSGLREGSKRCLQWRQVRQEGGGLGGGEEGVEEEELVAVVVDVEASSMGDRSSECGGQETRHRLCFRGEEDGRGTEAQGVASREFATTTQRIGAKEREMLVELSWGVRNKKKKTLHLSTFSFFRFVFT